MKPLRRLNQNFAECRWLLALLGVFLAPAVWATIPLYVNGANSIYTIPGTPPPQIDARGFLNQSGYTFQVGYETYEAGAPLYETLNTLFYTNAGTMIANGASLTNSYSVFYGALLAGLNTTFAVGYQFDQQTSSQNLWAGTFFNSGSIRCGAEADGNDFYYVDEYFGTQQSYYIPDTIGNCVVAATNIINPGTIDVSYLGSISLTGANVDLSQGELTQDPLLSLTGYTGEAPINSQGATGINTNIFWNPAVALEPPYAESSYVPGLSFNINTPYFSFLALTNCQSYAAVDEIGTNDFIYRYVFIENDSANAPAQVYFDPIDRENPNFVDDYIIEPGEVHVQWTESYLDPASGAAVNSYLYLSDAYLYGATTNNFVYNGLPITLDVTEYPTPVTMLTGPAAQAFYGVTPDASMTNNYAAFVGTLTAATASTNITYSNPHGAVTNVPGQVHISASKQLNLAFSRISGLNYLNLNCTNQFNGSPGAYIAAPYSDISLGVTNGFLTISNVLVANLPSWGGPISAWSCVWDDYTTTPGVTNEFRVLIVSSDLSSTALPWIQNLYLHGTNTLSVSDHLNVYGSFYSDAKVLVLQTNQAGQGATSLDGEINYINNSINSGAFNANSGSGVQQMPNLLWVTNYGMLKLPNSATFGSASTPSFVLSAGLAPVTNFTSFNNHSLVSDQGTTIWTGYFENDGKINNGAGSFALHTGLAFLTNGSLQAGADVLLTATNNVGPGGNTLVISNELIVAGDKLTLWTTNLSGDTPTNRNIFSVGASSGGGAGDSGFNTYVKPIVGNLLGATVTNIAPYKKTIYNVWAGHDFGLSPAGYTNNLAIGHLVLESFTTNQTGPIAFAFNGPDATNAYALYVDLLELKGGATGGDLTNNYNFPWLSIGTNITIYYAQALENGKSVAEAIDGQSRLGANNGRLRWVYSYAGYNSSTNLYYTNTDGTITTNTVNTALAESAHIDSDSDGIPNGSDPTPFFENSELHFMAALTNRPPQSVRVQWTTIPNATNIVYYSTNLFATNWTQFTNYTNWFFGNSAAWPNAPLSPQVYINDPNLGDNTQQTNVWLFDTITNVPHYYKVVVLPALDFTP